LESRRATSNNNHSGQNVAQSGGHTYANQGLRARNPVIMSMTTSPQMLLPLS